MCLNNINISRSTGNIQNDLSIDFDVCQENPCDNGGICKNVDGGQFTCKCNDGYRGMTCEGRKQQWGKYSKHKLKLNA